MMNKDIKLEPSVIAPMNETDSSRTESKKKLEDVAGPRRPSNEDRPSVQFPWRLHELLTEAETNGNDAVISWIPGTDNAFKVHNKEKFTNDILPEYFNATKYKSFQRNLNLWGFDSITEGPNKGGCQHPIFIRGDREKCHYMSRQKVKGIKKEPLKAKDMTLPEVESDMKRNTLANNPLGMTTPANIQLQALQNFGADPQTPNFCEKLHVVLALTELQGFMRWTNDGRCIAVVNPYMFNGFIFKSCFPNMTLPSFLAELENYGFKKISHSGFQDCYYHDLVIQGCRHLCKYLTTPEDSRRFVSEDPKKDLSFPEARNVLMAPASSTQPLPTDPSLQHLLQLQQQHTHHQQQQQSGLGAMLSHHVQRQPDAISGLALAAMGGGQTQLGPAAAAAAAAAGLSGLNPPYQQLLGNEMQNRSAIAAFLEMQMRASGTNVGSGVPVDDSSNAPGPGHAQV